VRKRERERKRKVFSFLPKENSREFFFFTMTKKN